MKEKVDINSVRKHCRNSALSRILFTSQLMIEVYLILVLNVVQILKTVSDNSKDLR